MQAESEEHAQYTTVAGLPVYTLSVNLALTLEETGRTSTLYERRDACPIETLREGIMRIRASFPVILVDRIVTNAMLPRIDDS